MEPNQSSIPCVLDLPGMRPEYEVNTIPSKVEFQNTWSQLTSTTTYGVNRANFALNYTAW
jgi:hypothetical protein